MYNNHGLPRFIKFGKPHGLQYNPNIPPTDINKRPFYNYTTQESSIPNWTLEYQRPKRTIAPTLPDDLVLFLKVQNGVIRDIVSDNVTSLTLNGTNVNTIVKRDGKEGSIYTNGGSLVTGADSKYLLGSNDFTLEFWFNSPVGTRSADIFGSRNGSNYNWVFFGSSSYMSTTGNSWDVPLSYTTTVPANNWTHICTTREGDTLRLFQNGILQSSRSVSGSIFSTDRIAIGGNTINEGLISAYYDDVKVTIGRAVYTSNFDVNTI
jgi:hypothetical protein